MNRSGKKKEYALSFQDNLHSSEERNAQIESVTLTASRRKRERGRGGGREEEIMHSKYLTACEQGTQLIKHKVFAGDTLPSSREYQYAYHSTDKLRERERRKIYSHPEQ